MTLDEFIARYNNYPWSLDDMAYEVVAKLDRNSSVEAQALFDAAQNCLSSDGELENVMHSVGLNLG